VPVRRRPTAAPAPEAEPGVEVVAAEAAVVDPVVAESELDELVDVGDVGEVTTVSASAPATSRRRTGGGAAGAGARRPRGA
jgi:hypothetical protein